MKILAVDLSNIFRANWEASEGREMGAAFDRTVAAIVRNRDGFDRVAICCDAGPSFRKAIDPVYKAHRTPPPAAYGEQLRRTVERLSADGCSIFHAPRMMPPAVPDGGEFYAEADDVIAALCAWAETLTTQTHVRIFGSDKDMLALVCDDDAHGVEVQRIDGSIFRTADVEAKIGLPPAKVPDWLGLAGDGSDGFKPFPGEMGENGRRKPGIGDKTAVRLLKAFGNIAGIFDAIEDDAIGEHERKILKTHGLDAGLRGLALATLRYDLPIDFSPLLSEPRVEQIAAAEYFEAPKSPPVTPEARNDPPSERRITALARVEPAQIVSAGVDRLAFQPRDLGSLWDTARALHNSRLYPQYGNPEAIMAIAIEANERGIPIGLALRNGYVVKGRPAWSASLLAALVMSSGKAEVFEIVESDAQHATLAYKRVGRPERAFTFTIEEARHAGWIKSGEKGDNKWITNPRTMLRWAAIREAARAFFPDVCSGMHTPDELRNGQVADEEWDQESAA